MKTWTLIADGGRARIVKGTGVGKSVKTIDGLEFVADHRPSHELLNDRATRVFESHGNARHAVEAKHDPHRMLKTDFAERLTALLDQRLDSGDFDRLVVIAPPVMLGDLRKAMSAALKAVTVAEIPKDLTKVPDVELAAHLADVPAL